MKYLIVGALVAAFVAISLYVIHRGDQRIAAARERLRQRLEELGQ